MLAKYLEINCYLVDIAFNTFSNPRMLAASTLTKPETGALMVRTKWPRIWSLDGKSAGGTGHTEQVCCPQSLPEY